MKYLIIDTENTGALRNKAHPFDPRNRMALCGVYDGKTPTIFNIEYYSDLPYGDAIRAVQHAVDKAEVLVGFNIKYDLHWLRRYGINFSGKMIWDCQLAEFIISNQQARYPSLAGTCEKYGLTKKKDILVDYIKRGIDVDGIPLDELHEYLLGDITSTHELFLLQCEQIKPYWPLFNLQCQDLVVLEEMEYNGLLFNLQLAANKVDECLQEEHKIKSLLKLYVHHDFVNWASNDHLSTILYGGTIRIVDRVPEGVYKTSAKAGQPKYKLVPKDYTFPRLVDPVGGSALMKPGYYSTAENFLKELKATGSAKAIIKLVLELGELEKLRGTYFSGIQERFKEFNWENGIMHGSINQCVAITGRTSSTKPNLQNIPSAAKLCFESRYKC